LFHSPDVTNYLFFGSLLGLISSRLGNARWSCYT
jgi:hypothetical protein